MLVVPLATLLLDAGPLDVLEPAAYVIGFFVGAVALGVVGTAGYLAYLGLRRWPTRHSAGRGGQLLNTLLLLAPAGLLVMGVVAFVVWVERKAAWLAQEQEQYLRQIEQERQQRADRKARLFTGLAGRYVFADTIASYPEWEKVEVASSTRECNTPPPATTRVELLIRPDSTFAYRSNLAAELTATTVKGRWRVESDDYIGFYAGSRRVVELQALVQEPEASVRVVGGYRDRCGNHIRFDLERISPTVESQPQDGGQAAR